MATFLEFPRHFDGEEEPGDDPEEEVEHGRNDEHQHRTVQGALKHAYGHIHLRDYFSLPCPPPRL